MTPSLVLDSYGRLSRNPDGKLEKIDRQLADNRRTIERIGATLGSELVDNSLSAWKRGVRRPGWEELLRRLESGESHGVVVWHTDRLLRQPRDLEKLIELAETRAIKMFSSFGVVDLGGELMGIRVAVAHAEQSSRDTSRRLKRMFEGRRSDGKVTFGGLRRFAFPGKDSAVEADENGERPLVSDALVARERRALAEAYRIMIEGGSMRSIVKAWNADGLRTSTGRDWQPITMRQILLRELNCGRIVHEGEVVGKANNVEPVVDEETFDIVKGIIVSRRRGPSMSGRYLGSGLIYCGRCGRGLVSRPRYDIKRYVCRADDKRGCGGIGIAMAQTDEVLREFVIERLSDPETAGLVNAALSARSAKVAELEAQIENATATAKRISAAFGAEEMDEDDYWAAYAPLRQRVKRLREELAGLTSATMDTSEMQARSVREIAAEFDKGTVEQRRILLKRALRGVRIEIAPHTGSHNVFDRRRVQVVPQRSPLS